MLLEGIAVSLLNQGAKKSILRTGVLRRLYENDGCFLSTKVAVRLVATIRRLTV